MLFNGLPLKSVWIPWNSSPHESCSTSSQTLEFKWPHRSCLMRDSVPLCSNYRKSLPTQNSRTVTDYVIKRHLFWPKLDDLEIILLSSHYAGRKVFAPLKADCHFSGSESQILKFRWEEAVRLETCRCSSKPSSSVSTTETFWKVSGLKVAIV